MRPRGHPRIGRGVFATILALAILGSSCAADPPWMNEAGEVVSASLILEYRGFHRCDTNRVTFLQFLGRQYAVDPRGDLGPLPATDGSGRLLTFELLEAVPPGTEYTGFTRGERSIHQGRDKEDYLYIVRPGVVERWPRAEIYCDGQQLPSEP